MKFKQKQYYIPIIVIVVFLAAVIGFGLKHQADIASRTQAQKAAAAYVKAAHTYLTTASAALAQIGGNTTDDQADAILVKFVKTEQSPTKLAVVKGAGANLAAYKAAAAYQAKVASFSKAADAANAADTVFYPFAYAYDVINAVYENINAGGLTSGDPTTAITKTIITPLTAEKTAFQKVPVPKAYATTAKDVNTLLDDYLGAGNTLVGMYKSGNLQSVNYNFYPQLLGLYNDLKPGDALDTQDLKLASQAQALVKQP